MQRKIRTCLLAASLMVGFAGSAHAGETPSSPDTKQYIVNLKDGDVISGPVTVIFGLSGMGVAPAGVEKAGTGHHHILLDRRPLGEGEDGKDELDNPLLSDDHNIHFGKGQTETVLELEPGKHTLQLVLGDHNHVPHNPPVSSKVITVEVK